MSNKTKRDIKIRPCLRCDRMFRTTPENRICDACTYLIRKSGMNTGYDSKNDGNSRK